jgi:hypothetical protein
MLTDVSELLTNSIITSIAWWWSQYAPLKRRMYFYQTTRCNIAEGAIFIHVAVRTWNLPSVYICYSPRQLLRSSGPVRVCTFLDHQSLGWTQSVPAANTKWGMNGSFCEALCFFLISLKFVLISFSFSHTQTHTNMFTQWMGRTFNTSGRKFAIINCSAACHCEAHNGPAHLLLGWSHPLKVPVRGPGKMVSVRYFLIDFSKSLPLFFLNSL